MKRLLVRKTINNDNPLIWIELPNGTSVSIGGMTHGRIRETEWTRQTFAAVERGEYSDWEVHEW